MKILIADDHTVVRQGLRQILTDALEGAQFGEAGDATEALERVWREHWDVLLLDVSMPGRNGLEILKPLSQQRPKLPVLVLSMHPEDQYAVRVLRAGAKGYLTKDMAVTDLVNAVKKVLAGGRYVSTSLADKLAAAVSTPAENLPHENLSDREFQVMRTLASGKTVSEIAAELSLSVKTISTHRTRILKKMGLHTNAQLMRYAVDHQLT